mgnify:CR=1 FL=1
MRMVDLIEKKKDNVVLTDEEIHELIQGYTKGDIPVSYTHLTLPTKLEV